MRIRRRIPPSVYTRYVKLCMQFLLSSFVRYNDFCIIDPRGCLTYMKAHSSPSVRVQCCFAFVCADSKIKLKASFNDPDG